MKGALSVQKKSNGYRLALYDAANLVEMLAEELRKEHTGERLEGVKS